MLHFVLRRSSDKEPLALFRINAKVENDMNISTLVYRGRFGPFVRIYRNAYHAYNLMLGSHDDVIQSLSYNPYTEKADFCLELVTKSEWESWDEMELFPRLKTSIVG